MEALPCEGACTEMSLQKEDRGRSKSQLSLLGRPAVTPIGVGGQDWPAVAAGATIFLVPVMVFTILLRKHLLRGITFGAVRK